MTSSKWSRAISVLGSALVVTAAGACGRPNSYVWVQDLPQAEASAPAADAGSYLIDAGDVLDIRVYNEDRLSTRARVRPDGYVTVSLVGDVLARGKTPSALGAELVQRMQKFLNSPIVTVGIEESRPMTITVVGEAENPGVYALPPRSGVLQALALAGGLSEFADLDHIYVVRKEPAQRIRFSYHALTNNDAASRSFQLKQGDVISVE